MKKLLFLKLSMIALILVSCNEEDTPSSGSSYEYYMYADLNGETIDIGLNLSDTAPDYLIGGSYSPGYYSDHCTMTYGPGIEPNLDWTNPMFYIEMNSFYYGENCDDEPESVNTTTFAVGSYPYSNDAGGVSIVYVPNSDEELYYSSEYGAQSSASFTITSSVEKNQSFFNYIYYNQEIEGTFSCRLYNPDDVSDYIDVTNGKYKLIVSSFSN
jgi:hypothetical protein